MATHLAFPPPTAPASDLGRLAFLALPLPHSSITGASPGDRRSCEMLRITELAGAVHEVRVMKVAKESSCSGPHSVTDLP